MHRDESGWARNGWPLVRFNELSRPAKTLRLGHIAIAVVELPCLLYVWSCALTGRRDRLLAAALATLSIQGGALLVGRGNCPLGGLQKRMGDPGPLFELILPPRAARLAVPVFGFIALAGVVVLIVRPRSIP